MNNQELTSTKFMNMQVGNYGRFHHNDDFAALAASPFDPPASMAVSPQNSQRLNNTRETILSQLTAANHTLRSYNCGKGPGQGEIAMSTL